MDGGLDLGAVGMDGDLEAGANGFVGGFGRLHRMRGLSGMHVSAPSLVGPVTLSAALGYPKFG